MANKPTIKYGVVNQVLPGETGEAVKRPYITSLPTYDVMRLVEYALNSGYIRGQKYDLVGIVNSVMDAALSLIKAGNSVSLASWVRFALALRGQVGEDYSLSETNNSLALNATTMQDFKVALSEFSWEYAGDMAAKMRIDRVASPNGTAGEWIKTKELVATGNNLVFNAAWGDVNTVTWVDASEQVHTLEIVPSEQSASYLRFAWPTELAEVAAGTALVLKFKLHGKEGGIEQAFTKTAKLVAA